MTDNQTQAAAPDQPARKVRSTTERMADLRDTVKRNVDKFGEKEAKLERELQTIRNARTAAQAELERIDQTLPPELRLPPSVGRNETIAAHAMQRADSEHRHGEVNGTGSSYAPTEAQQ